MKFRPLLFGGLLLMAIASVPAQQPVSHNAGLSTSRGYLVGPGDLISVKVLGEKEFDFTSRVDEDGSIHVPFSDTPLNVKCQNRNEIAAAVRTSLQKFIRQPQLDLDIPERNHRPRVTIHGDVRQPAQIRLTQRARLTNILAEALGPNDTATGLIQLVRSTSPVCQEDLALNPWTAEPGAEAIVRILSLADLHKGIEGNPIIFPGDEITVLKAPPVFVNGEVIVPGASLIKERGLTLTEAIAQAGGLRPEAKKKDVKVYRIKQGSTDREEITASLDLINASKASDIPLMPYDIVVVGKTKDSVAMMMFKFAIGVGKQAAFAVGTGSGYKVTSY